METTEAGIGQWVRLIRAEYNEMPGLQLTKPQVRRLWGLDPPTCDRLLAELEQTHFLRRTETNAYVRAEVER